MNNTSTRFAFTRFAILLTFVFVGLLTSLRLDAQNAWWTWVSGNPTADNPPSWGTKGVPAASNDPGARIGNSGWADANGNFWIFGGETPSEGFYDDLWEFTPATGGPGGTWTWVSGVNNNNDNPGFYGTLYTPSASNMPGGRYGQCGFTDKKGNFWIFGGYGYDINGQYQYLNDLWEYTPSKNGSGQWTWMGGDDIMNQTGSYGEVTGQGTVLKPGARVWASGWADANGKIWIFGGQGYGWNSTVGTLNDLWMYDPGSHLWTWVGGNYYTGAQGNYGTRKQTNGANNFPGARYGQQVTVDALGNFWLFGGVSQPASFTYPANSANDYLNDLWEYTPKNGYWTWIAGSNTPNQDGTYGTKGVMAKGNVPGARFQGAFQIDINGNFWVFGGYGLNNSVGGYNELNDLWTYNPTSDAWAWMNGPQADVTPTYGQQGTANANNVPPGEQGLANWMDRLGNLYVFGGGTGAPNQFYDNLWYTPTPFVSLPLQEVSLQGVPQGQGNMLTWQTVDELNTARFGVQRSTDGADFSDVGSVAAEGSGNNSYSFDDAALPAGAGTFYYRLKMVDRDSSFSWSTTIIVHDGEASSAGLILYPNPAQGSSTLQLPANSGLLNTPASLFDIGGRMIRQYLITSQQQPIDLSNIPQGVYLLKLANGTTLRLVKG
jgi:N-acetylneuraminic acid mutarotase